MAVLVILVGGVLPGTSAFFGLEPWGALGAYLPTAISGFALGTLQKRGRVSPLGFGLLAILVATCFQFFMWSLVSRSRLPGSTVMASLPILLACYHGYAVRAGPRTPYIAVAIVLGAALALIGNTRQETLAIFAAGVPIAIGSSLILGHNAVAQMHVRNELTALRDAVSSKVLSERTRHVEVLTQALARLQGTSHDAGNALSGVLFNLEQIAIESRRRPLSAERCERIGEMATDAALGFEVLHGLLRRARDLAKESVPQLERVDLHAVLKDAVEATRARYPHIEFTLHSKGSSGRGAVASVSGGRESAYRILSNLLLNACQGNGANGASEVAAEVVEENETVGVFIRDDGPGFPRSMLLAPFQGLSTGKSDGTGLGLYISDQLMRASGGRIRVGNSEGKGAVVELTFERRDVT